MVFDEEIHSLRRDIDRLERNSGSDSYNKLEVDNKLATKLNRDSNVLLVNNLVSDNVMTCTSTLKNTTGFAASNGCVLTSVKKWDTWETIGDRAIKIVTPGIGRYEEVKNSETIKFKPNTTYICKAKVVKTDTSKIRCGIEEATTIPSYHASVQECIDVGVHDIYVEYTTTDRVDSELRFICATGEIVATTFYIGEIFIYEKKLLQEPNIYLSDEIFQDKLSHFSGSGSGLNADKLDGNDSSYYGKQSDINTINQNLTNKTELSVGYITVASVTANVQGAVDVTLPVPVNDLRFLVWTAGGIIGHVQLRGRSGNVATIGYVFNSTGTNRSINYAYW